MSIPETSQPILNGLKKRQAPSLSTYPDLALAGTANHGEPMKTDGPDFGSVMGCLEAVNRLSIGARSCYALGLLCKCGPMNASTLASRLRIAPSSTTLLLRNLQGLGLITARRADADTDDRREVIATATAAAHGVMCSLTALTALSRAKSLHLAGQIKTNN